MLLLIMEEDKRKWPTSFRIERW